jgi:3'-phosphoadenosine 5'-phosphosulfate sulfotransferase (PAPS reductase)/FAD synthetase
LANDILEIALKCGYGVSLHESRGSYIIGLSHRKLTPRLGKEPKYIDYSGKVYCVEIPNHVILVERNGKFCWSGNSIGCSPCTRPAPPEAPERAGRDQDKELIMRRLRELGYW